ncbi:uncharacterized protein LOC117100740, partial [Anneissia japonica]|uniref:uncharacterized protein LOC117100740 n=1 Tax=Anneissia japonica TaxID=1529436 RepID=UPI00142593C6
MEYGALLSIKDKYGKTPLDLYDNNACSEYDKFSKGDNKLNMRQSLEDRAVPSEILARGGDALKAYNDAKENGTMTVVNSRMKFLGKEGSGKTCCIKAMLGKEFNQKEPPTDGIVKIIVFQTVGSDWSKWEEQENIDVCGRTKQVLDDAIIARTAEELLKTQHSTSGHSSTKSVTLPASSSIHPGEKRKVKKSLSVPTSTFKSDKPPIKKLIKEIQDQIIKSSTADLSGVTCIWDYA